MKKQIKFHSSIWLTVAVTVITSLIAGLIYSGLQSAKANASSNFPNVSQDVDISTEAPPDISVSTETDTSQPQTSVQENQIVSPPVAVFDRIKTVNDFSVELVSVKREGDYLRADVCFPLPSDADWLPADRPDDVLLTVKDQVIPLYGGGLIEFVTSPDGIRTHRCDYLQFLVGASQNLSQFTLTLKQLTAQGSEQPDCSKVQEKLDKANTGIVIQCNHGENTFGYDIVEKPSSMDDYQARMVVHEAFYERVKGPWVFEAGLSE